MLSSFLRSQEVYAAALQSKAAKRNRWTARNNLLCIEVPVVFLIVSTLAAGLFAGAAIYVSAVEHPARVSCGTDLAVREFAPSYKRGAIMQASLALVGCMTGFIGGWQLNDIGIYHRCLDSRGCRAVHADCHTSDEQTPARSRFGPTWRRGFTPIESMGSAACRPERLVGGGLSDLSDRLLMLGGA